MEDGNETTLYDGYLFINFMFRSKGYRGSGKFQKQVLGFTPRLKKRSGDTRFLQKVVASGRFVGLRRPT